MTTHYQCLNCPDVPLFPSMSSLEEHWKATHTAPMVITQVDPWGERKPRTIRLYKAVEVNVVGDAPTPAGAR